MWGAFVGAENPWEGFGTGFGVGKWGLQGSKATMKQWMCGWRDGTTLAVLEKGQPHWRATPKHILLALNNKKNNIKKRHDLQL